MSTAGGIVVEEIGWIACADELPDSDTTVLIFGPLGAEPVWLGYYGQTDACVTDEGDTLGAQSAWFSVDGEELVAGSATHWAVMPRGPR